jgi:hypothetical protein
MRSVSYLKRASKRFLEGTRFRSPFEAVDAGVHSLERWVEVLAEEREAAQARKDSKLERRVSLRGKSGVMAGMSAQQNTR